MRRFSRAERALVEVWNGLALDGLAQSRGGAICQRAVRRVLHLEPVLHRHRRTRLSRAGRDLDATSWRIQTTPTVAKYGTWPTGISCVAADACTMVGGYNTVKRREQAVGAPLAERWNGRRWSVQHAPAYGLYFPALSSVSCVSRSFCLASGTHHLGNGSIADSPFAERWNGQRWTAARAGLPKYSSLNGVSCL